MKFLNLLLTVALAAFVSALPTKRDSSSTNLPKSGSDPQPRGTPGTRAFTDFDVIQYILSLEHIENALYQLGMGNYTEEDFVNGGYSSEIYGRYQQIVFNENNHVLALTKALVDAGVEPTPSCYTNFAFTTLDGFIQATHSLENVNSPSRSNAAYLLEDPDLAALVISLFGTEARQASWIGSHVFNQNPWNTPFDTHLTPRQVYTLGKSFVLSCPTTLPFVPGLTDGLFPTLNVTLHQENSTATFDFVRPTGALADQPLYAAFIQGNLTAYAPIDNATGEVVVPQGLRGFVFGLVSTQFGHADDNATFAGPATLQFPYDANSQLIAGAEQPS